ncbi:MAG: hypothetical protein ABIK92_12825 [Pseudomonadota bacterium]
MKISGAVIKEQAVTFAIVIVNKSAMQTIQVSRKTRAAYQGLFPGIPLILASKSSCGLFEYQGSKDLLGFMKLIDPSLIPWKEYTVS